MFSQDSENRKLKELQSINKLIYVKLNLRPGIFAGDLRCGKIESFQISFERASEEESWIGSGMEFQMLGAQTLKARFPIDVWVCGCLKRDLSDECSSDEWEQKSLYIVMWCLQVTLNKEFEGNCWDFEFYSRINREPLK